jgi:hypothetical protein
LTLNYKVVDKITFKNTVVIFEDYVNSTNNTPIRLNSVLTFFKVSGSWDSRTFPATGTKIFEWDGGDGDISLFKGEFGILRDWSEVGLQLKWTTVVTVQIEAGFTYYLVK